MDPADKDQKLEAVSKPSPSSSHEQACLFFLQPKPPCPHHPLKHTQQAAQEMFGKPFADLEPHERVRAGGKVGGGIKGGDLADPERAPPPPDVKVRW
jgi:hypothetical protein